MPAPLLGTGAGVSAGIVLATQAGAWALAAGGAYEKRGSYTPIEASIAGVTTSTDLRPGAMMHFTLGADRLLGENRLSLLAAADMYAADEVSASGNGSAASGTYQLGPSYTVLAALDIGAAAFRELRITVSDRFRTAFKGLDGLTAPGSSGSYLDLSARGVLGRPGRSASSSASMRTTTAASRWTTPLPRRRCRPPASRSAWRSRREGTRCSRSPASRPATSTRGLAAARCGG